MAIKNATFGKRGAASPNVSYAVAPPVVTKEVIAPEKSASSISRFPWFTAVLCGTLIFKFNTELRSATDFTAPFSPGHFTLLALGGASRTQVLGAGEWWRLFTATALHASPSHLIGNLVALAVAGFLLEPFVGLGWFAAIYFVGALGGAFASIMLNSPDVLTVGASGAIMACLSAIFALSFHDGVKRPGLMRRVSGYLLFPALLPTVSHGAQVDVSAHLGGLMTGGALAMMLLIAWPEEGRLPGRNLAALLAGGLLALTIWSFMISWDSYDRYAQNGLDFIPPSELQSGIDQIEAKSLLLEEKYPKDPRAHYFRGLYFLQQNNLADAEPHLEQAMQLAEHGDGITKQFRDSVRATFALDVAELGRKDEARTIAAPVCRSPDLEDNVLKALNQDTLC